MIGKRSFVLSVVIAALGTTCFAQQSCFSRSYGATHMQSNPNQTVQQFAMRFEGPAKQANDTGEWADVTVYFNDGPIKFTNTLYCSISDGKRWCGVECDGGGAYVTWKNADTILVKTQGFIVSGGCDAEDEPTRMVKDKTAGFTTFRLNRSGMSACPPLNAN